MNKKEKLIDCLINNRVLTDKDVRKIGLSDRARQSYLKSIRDNDEDIYPFSVSDSRETINGVTGWFVFDIDEDELVTFKQTFKRQVDIRYRAENLLSIEASDFQNTILSDTYVSDEVSNKFQHILLEIRAKKRITIKYADHRKTKIEEFENIVPMFLKENRYGRFYLIAHTKKIDSDIAIENVKTFGLDRIMSVSTTTIPFTYDESFKKIKKFFENLVGTHIPNKPQEVNDLLTDEPPMIKVQVTNFQAKYMASMPLHHSQEPKMVNEIEENGKDVVFTFKLWPTIEFVSQLVLQNNLLNQDVGNDNLSHPTKTAIKVLEPKWLKKWTASVSKRILRDHSDDEELREKLSKEINVEKLDFIKYI